MTTEQASKLKRGQVVIFDDRQFSIGAGRRLTVELVQIALNTMSVILTCEDGEVVKCKAEHLTHCY